MRVLICGLGSIGRRHGRNFRALGIKDIVGFDPDPDRRAQFGAEVGAAVTDDFESELRTRPDLVAVTSPNRFHLDQAIATANAGCHTFIEKPLTHQPGGIDELQSIVDDKRLFVHIGSNFKFHPAFVTMKDYVEQGALGRITGAQVLAGQWLPDWHPWEDYRRMYSSRRALGGGILLDAHELIYLTWLLGPVKDVTGLTAHSGALEIETEDVAAVCLRFARGTIATVQLDYIQRETRRRYHLSGDAGTLEWDIGKPDVEFYDAASKSTKLIPAAMADLNDMYIAQAEHILKGAKGEVSPLTPISEARQALDIVFKVKAANG